MKTESEAKQFLRTSLRWSQIKLSKAPATKGREAKRAHCQEIVRSVESSCNLLHIVGFVTLLDYPWNILRCWQLRGI